MRTHTTSNFERTSSTAFTFVMIFGVFTILRQILRCVKNMDVSSGTNKARENGAERAQKANTYSPSSRGLVIGSRGRFRAGYSLCVGSLDSSCIFTGEIFSDRGGPWKPMGPGPPAAPTRCITPAPPISAAPPLLRTSRDGFRAILKPSYRPPPVVPVNSRNLNGARERPPRRENVTAEDHRRSRAAVDPDGRRFLPRPVEIRQHRNCAGIFIRDREPLGVYCRDTTTLRAVNRSLSIFVSGPALQPCRNRRSLEIRRLKGSLSLCAFVDSRRA